MRLVNLSVEGCRKADRKNQRDAKKGSPRGESDLGGKNEMEVGAGKWERE